MTRYHHLITDENRKWWTLGAMCFALFMIMLDNTVVNVALPSIQKDLHASISGLEWTTSGYTLSFAVILATGGRLGDIFGRRRVFLIGVVIFALSSATAGLAPDQTALVVSRVVQGIGAGADDAGHPVDHHRRVSSPRAWEGDGHLGRGLRPGARDRPGAGRIAHRARLLARDLLPQRSRRDRRRRGHHLRRPRVARHERRQGGRLPRRRDPDDGPHGARPRPRRGQQLGLGVGRRSSRCWPARSSGLRPSSSSRSASRPRSSSSSCCRTATTWVPRSSP